VIAASVAMGVAVWAGWRAWTAALPATKTTEALGLALLIGAGVAIYAALMWAMKIEGRDELVAMLRRKRGE
jgi:putative peptidoglycan lipid II flippase